MTLRADDMPEACCDHPDWIFVFGSNLAGRHGKGAALHAKKFHSAWNKVGVGLMGCREKKNDHSGTRWPTSYAIPTKDENLKTLDLRLIRIYVNRFLGCAKDLSGCTFYVTRIGCGLAGYKDADIAPMFKDAPDNCILPEGWRDKDDFAIGKASLKFRVIETPEGISGQE